jgi:hypothetical protein
MPTGNNVLFKGDKPVAAVGSEPIEVPISRNVGGENGCEPPFDPLSAQSSLHVPDRLCSHPW